ncbi:MAG: hypothetical protein P4M11_13755 [Candidatus Pacebacteria bacterium]|nr:hypothetical protein [Candidatus Paceibacterota bacterium]
MLNGTPTTLMCRKCIAHRFDSELGAYSNGKGLKEEKQAEDRTEKEYLILVHKMVMIE